jgi:hypothetical protein
MRLSIRFEFLLIQGVAARLHEQTPITRAVKFDSRGDRRFNACDFLKWDHLQVLAIGERGYW